MRIDETQFEKVIKIILDSIRSKHVISGIEELERIGEENWRPSTKYDLFYEGKYYPPKEVIRNAGIIATEEEPIYFSGGDESNNLLIDLGFSIVLKNTLESIERDYVRNQHAGKVKVSLSPALVEEKRSIDKILDSKNISETEKEHLIKVRTGQGLFRDSLFSKFSKCTLCGISDKRLLIASHIKPWRYSEDTEKLSIHNGLLFCPNHDWPFDKGFITFSESGVLIISNELDETSRFFMNVNSSMRVTLNEEQNDYLKWHRDFVFQD